MGNFQSTPPLVDPVKDELVFGKVEFPQTELPYDEEGFVKSFQFDQDEEYLKFFNEYGFVVIDNILTQDECNSSIEEIWNALESRSWCLFEDVKVDRNDSKTWIDKYFPGSKLGLFDSRPATGVIAWKNRLNEKLYRVFSKIYGKEKLWVSLDRYGVMRPTKSVPFGKLKPEVYRWKVEADDNENDELQVLDFPQWKTHNLWLHWDLNPWIWTGSTEGVDYQFSDFIQENNGSRNNGDRKLQGLITFTESKEDDGGFTCVPGFHKHLKEWAQQTKDTVSAQRLKTQYSFCNVPSNDCVFNQAKKIVSRAGSLIIWSSELPHCNHAVESNRFRLNQYIKMFPAQEGKPNTDVRRKCIEEMMEGKDINETQQKLLGLKNW